MELSREYLISYENQNKAMTLKTESIVTVITILMIVIFFIIRNKYLTDASTIPSLCLSVIIIAPVSEMILLLIIILRDLHYIKLVTEGKIMVFVDRITGKFSEEYDGRPNDFFIEGYISKKHSVEQSIYNRIQIGDSVFFVTDLKGRTFFHRQGSFGPYKDMGPFPCKDFYISTDLMPCFRSTF